LDPAQLRALLARSLPAHEVPAAVLVLETLPLTGSGKLDRRALPKVLDGDPAAARPGEGGAARPDAPADDLEQLLLGLFARLLGGPEPGLDDSFFDRGGHSLSAVRLIGRIRTATGVELTVRDLFDTPTVSGLARLVRARTT
jgi:acyl carrier protein